MITFLFESPFLPTFLLLGSLLLTICNTAFAYLGKFKSKEYLQSSHGPSFFFKPIIKKCFRHHEWENLYFCTSISKQIYQAGYAISAFFFLISRFPHLHNELLKAPQLHNWAVIGLISGSIIALSVLLDFLMRLLAHLWSRPLLKIAAPFASFFLLILFPLTYPLLKLTRTLIHKVYFEEDGELVTDRTKLKEMLKDSELNRHLDLSDQKLITSFLNFKQRVVKEIMVPRVDVFSLASDTPIHEAATLFATEGYSRIPVYKDNLDQIIGVILYKDLLKSFTSEKQNLDATLASIAKPVLYAPENKKIAQLLQEFRSKQIHMAIIVDEYGGTEGIVTIEDILEELVGEIEDEYDVGEADEFWELPGGGWIVDAKMTLIDIENQMGILIPENPEYETIGGYVFHCAGTIPTKGWLLSRDEFDLEVLSSDERSLKKIKLLPRQKKSDN